MFTSKKDIEELKERVASLERQMHRVLRAAAPQTEKVAVRKQGRRTPHSSRQLVYTFENRIDVEASAEAIGRTLHEIIRGSWPRDSAESRIGYALRASNPGSGGIISREQWLQENPEQLEFFPR
jgi:hypothetical protein